MEFILASKNSHKAEEMCAILGDGFSLQTQNDAGFGDIDVIEDGETFEENAIKKAVSIMQASGKAAIADDSGLCVDALCGNPGVKTARFAGEDATDEENIKKLLDVMKDIPESERTARFVCVIAIAIPGKAPITYRGECEGSILYEKRGENGFGYDPVFCVKKFGKSAAELPPEVKNNVSHRYAALNKMKNEFTL